MDGINCFNSRQAIQIVWIQTFTWAVSSWSGVWGGITVDSLVCWYVMTDEPPCHDVKRLGISAVIRCHS